MKTKNEVTWNIKETRKLCSITYSRKYITFISGNMENSEGKAERSSQHMHRSFKMPPKKEKKSMKSREIESKSNTTER